MPTLESSSPNARGWEGIPVPEAEPSLSTTAVRPGDPSHSTNLPSGAHFLVHTRRHDGERPLAIVAGLVVLLCIYLDLTAGRHAHDWRAVAFYTGFGLFALTACVLLSLQWRNEMVSLSSEGLLHHDWLRRPTLYPWNVVRSTTEKRRVDNTRFILELTTTRSVVLHSDWHAYSGAVRFAEEQLGRVGVGVVREG